MRKESTEILPINKPEMHYKERKMQEWKYMGDGWKFERWRLKEREVWMKWRINVKSWLIETCGDRRKRIKEKKGNIERVDKDGDRRLTDRDREEEKA